MRSSKPDLFILLAVLFVVSALISSYTVGESDPNKVAQSIVVH